MVKIKKLAKTGPDKTSHPLEQMIATNVSEIEDLTANSVYQIF